MLFGSPTQKLVSQRACYSNITFIMHIRMLFSVWGTHISWLRVKQRNINFTSVEHRSKDMEWIEAQARTRRDILPICKNRLEFMHSPLWQLRSYRSTSEYIVVIQKNLVLKKKLVIQKNLVRPMMINGPHGRSRRFYRATSVKGQ